MQDVAPCLHADCADCALRQIRRHDSSDFSCYGGIDIATFDYVMPCTLCCERVIPSTQDYEEFDLDSFLAEAENQEDSHGMEHNPSLGELIFGQQTAEQVCDEIMSAQRTWPEVSCPLLDERIIQQDGASLRFRFYKPFQRIQPDEREDFKQFLQLIF